MQYFIFLIFGTGYDLKDLEAAVENFTTTGGVS